MGAGHAGGAHPSRLYLGNDGGLFWHAPREKQPGGGTDQFCEEYWWQHSDLADECGSGGTSAISSEPAFEVPDAHERELTTAGAVADRLFRWPQRSSKCGRPCTGQDLQRTDPAVADAGLR